MLMETVQHFMYGNWTREVLTYYVHHILYHLWFYTRYHKLHHSFNASIALTGSYTDPVEHFFADIIPIVLSLTLLIRYHEPSAYSIVQCLSDQCASCGYVETRNTMDMTSLSLMCQMYTTCTTRNSTWTMARCILWTGCTRQTCCYGRRPPEQERTVEDLGTLRKDHFSKIFWVGERFPIHDKRLSSIRSLNLSEWNKFSKVSRHHCILPEEHSSLASRVALMMIMVFAASIRHSLHITRCHQ